MGWSSKYKSQGKSNTSRGKHHTLLQIVMLYSHSCSKLQKKKHLEFGKKGCNWGSWVEVTKQIPGCQGTLTRSPSLIIVAACIGNGFSLQGNETYVFSVKHLVPPSHHGVLLKKNRVSVFIFWRHEIHPLRISGVSPTKKKRTGASRSRRSAGVSRVVFALVCLSITPTSEGKQPIKSNMQISRSLWHMGHEQCKMILISILFGTGFHMFHITSLQGSELSQSGRAPPPFRFWVSQLWWEHQVRKLFLKVLVTPKEVHWKIQLKTTTQRQPAINY